MRMIKKIKQLFWLVVMSQFLMSSSILLMPVAVRVEQQDGKMTVLIGLLFWSFTITGYVLLAMANSKRKRFINRKIDGNLQMNCRPGIAEFFTNVPAKVADVTMILSFFVFMIISFTEWRYKYISYVLLFVLFFSFHMHCMFNGRIYKVTKYKRARRESNYE